MCGGRGQELGRKVSCVNAEKLQHRGRRFSRDAARKARPGASARTDLPQRKESGPFFFFFAFLCFLHLNWPQIDWC